MTAAPLEVVRPGDAGYARVRDVYGATGRPAAVVLPAAPGEVPAALDWARARPGPLAVRSGGHGISSLATNDGGVVLDLRHIAGIERLDGPPRADRRRGALGRGRTRAGPWGLAISSGDSGDVGVGGLATTGGIGLMGRAHGLTIDRLVRAEVVHRRRGVVQASVDEHPDLFWAVRGAGANFGIVTASSSRPPRRRGSRRRRSATGRPGSPRSWSAGARSSSRPRGRSPPSSTSSAARRRSPRRPSSSRATIPPRRAGRSGRSWTGARSSGARRDRPVRRRCR